MRAGYLDALAARTLGQALLLRPLTPSRFEPIAQALQIDTLEVSEPGTATTPVSAQLPEGLAPTPPTPDSGRAGTAEAALLGSVDPDRPAGRPIDPRPGDTAQIAPPLRGQDGALAIGALASGVYAAPHAAHLDPPDPGPAVPPPGPGRTISAARRDADPLSPTVTATGAETAAPPVIVHIGRIEVRAAPTPAGPAVTSRPVPIAATPSLAEHLRARDRELA